MARPPTRPLFPGSHDAFATSTNGSTRPDGRTYPNGGWSSGHRRDILALVDLPGDERPLRVLLADDDRLFAEALRAVLVEDERIDVVGHAANGEEAVALAGVLTPDVVLMDLKMPRMGGIEATRRIRDAFSSTCVLIVAGNASSAEIQRAAEAGAIGYLGKDSVASDLVGAIIELAALAGASTADTRS